MRHLVIGLLFSTMFLSGCELQASWEGTKNAPDAPKQVIQKEEIKWEEYVVMCQNVEVTQTKEKTESKVKFEGFQHVERHPQMGQRNISHCIPCTSATSEREKKVCVGDAGVEKKD